MTDDYDTSRFHDRSSIDEFIDASVASYVPTTITHHELAKHGVRDAATVCPSDASVGPSDASSLTELDRNVVYLSLRDGLEPSDTRHTMLRWRVPLCRQDNKRLANMRLEALRQYAVQFRTSGGLTTAKQRAAVLAAGYGDAQVNSVEDLVRLLKPDLATQHPSHLLKTFVLAAAALCVVLCGWLEHTLQSGAIALIITGLSAVTLASLFSGGSR